MTDTIPRQAVIDAIAGERLNEDTGSEGDAAYERALDDVLAAINAIPAVDEWQPIETAPKSGKRVYAEKTQPKTRIVAAWGE